MDFKFEAGVHCLGDEYEGNRAEYAELVEALSGGYEVVWEGGGHEGYGHHSLNAVIKLADGRFIHAECGGCSCWGSGSWSFCADEEEARRLVPEQERNF